MTVIDMNKRRINTGKSNGMYGKRSPNAQRVRIYGTEYRSIKEACESLNISRSTYHYRKNFWDGWVTYLEN